MPSRHHRDENNIPRSKWRLPPGQVYVNLEEDYIPYYAYQGFDTSSFTGETMPDDWRPDLCE